MNTLLSARVIPSLSVLALVIGCSSTSESLPDYNPATNAAAQADSFIYAENEEYMKGVNKIGVMSCNVMFGMTSSASASTSGGFRAGATRATGTVSRSDVKISVTYTASGLEETELQRLADQACENAELELSNAGFELVPHSKIKTNKYYQELHAGGQASPFEFKGKGDTRYLVLGRNGETISDPRYISTASGFSQVFKSIGGDSSEQIEDFLMKDLGMTGVNINLLIDFASLQSDGDKSFAGLSNKDTAKVDASIQLAVSGDIRFQPITQQKCWSEWGKEKCMVKPSHQPVFGSKRDVASSTIFYESIEDATTTADKVTSGLTKTLGFLSALGGTSSSVARDITRYQVNIIPTVYETESKKLTSGLVEMAATKAVSKK
ncbi:hypothetical protein DS2_09402 [Catenovulum agarivorans DS-2]|uniref:Lipoprotein n=1 Tax=Catenovulum agarivorans DS-2 TaxID=1328313 RepID=W7QDZ7_9ALTE|nr:hypothetical protein [Catenovulum agarivorans]EWH10151.1 hypothetical protein DS2_09402 [Catenovulum agarivorans DS-2]